MFRKKTYFYALIIKHHKMPKSNSVLLFNIILFALGFIYIFVVGLFPKTFNLEVTYNIVISFIYFFSILIFKEKRGTINRESILFKRISMPLFIVILLWLGMFFHLPALVKITGFISTIFFLVVVVFLVIQIANSKTIGFMEFLESVNTYLLFGIAASILFRAIYDINPANFSSSVDSLNSQSDFIYFAFVTLTTLGYGDILPVSPGAKSLTIFFSVSGQLYLTMIVALLVGKYLNAKN